MYLSLLNFAYKNTEDNYLEEYYSVTLILMYLMQFDGCLKWN